MSVSKKVKMLSEFQTFGLVLSVYSIYVCICSTLNKKIQGING